ncbi:MAG: phytanoyl-CoA dioxygenase family protein [Pseudonocardiaceae bacterium]
MQEKVEEFKTQGYTVLPSFIDGDVLEWLHAEADELIGRFAEGERAEDYWRYDVPGRDLPILYRIHNLEKQGTPGIGELFSGHVQRELARTFIGGGALPTVCAMIIKTSGVAEVPWHRDRVNVPPAAALNLSVYLDNSRADNGCFELVPASHLLSDDADPIATRDKGPTVQVPAAPGDVLVHDVRLVHGSGPNEGDLVRRSIITEFAV